MEYYQKYYKEALKKARLFYNAGDCSRETLEMLKIIFPELDENGKIFKIEKGKSYKCTKTWTAKENLYKEGGIYVSDMDDFLVADDGESYIWPSPKVASSYFEEFKQ